MWQAQVDEVLSKLRFTTGLKCESALRVAAATVRRGASSEITATTVVCEVQRAEFEVLEARVQDIADEHGLHATIQQQRGFYAVRFTRRRPISNLTAGRIV